MFMIAKLVEKAPRVKTKEVGFRIYDENELEYRDYTKEELVTAVKNGLVIENLRVNINKGKVFFVGHPTSTVFYPTVGVEGLTKDNLVLVKYIPNNTYFCVNRDGKLFTYTYEGFMRKYSENKICNLHKNISRYIEK